MRKSATVLARMRSFAFFLLTNVVHVLCLHFHCRSIHTFDPTLSLMSSATSFASCLSCQFMPLILGSACSSSATTSTMSTLILFETATKVSTTSTPTLNNSLSRQPRLFPCPHILDGCQERKDEELPKQVFLTSHCCHVGRPHYLRCCISRRSNLRRILCFLVMQMKDCVEYFFKTQMCNFVLIFNV